MASRPGGVPTCRVHHPSPHGSSRSFLACPLAWLAGICFLLAGPVAQSTLLPRNFWPNPTFESGSNLDQPDGLVADWNRGGNDPTICQIVAGPSGGSGHALAVMDLNEGDLYGEWYSDVTLGDRASAGDTLNIRWSEMYQLSGSEMRLTVSFLNAAGAGVGETHFVTTGTTNAGWRGNIADSAFTRRNGSVLVPAGAVKMTCSLVSGGPGTLTGLMVIDDLTVAVHPATIQAGNLFPNPTFEEGEQLDNPTGALPAGIWSRGGSDGTIDRVDTGKAVSPSHALSLVDNNETGYGEWYGFLALPGVKPGELLDFQWFQLYSVTNGSMRLTLAFTDASNAQLESHDYNVTGQSSGWLGSVAASPFERQNQRLRVPEGTAKLRVNLASGGSSLVTGTMLIDDLSVRIGRLEITGFVHDAAGFQLTGSSAPGETYTVQYAGILDAWESLATGLTADGPSTQYTDTTVRAGKVAFYRVLRE